MFVLGITFVKSNTIEMDVALARGASQQGRWLHVPLQRRENIEGPNFDGFRGHVTALRNGKSWRTQARRSATISCRDRS